MLKVRFYLEVPFKSRTFVTSIRSNGAAYNFRHSKDMINYKISKTSPLAERNCDMAHNFYYKVSFRVSDNKLKEYKRLSCVVWLDVFDVAEMLDKDTFSKEEIKRCVKECAANKILCYIKDFNDDKGFAIAKHVCERSITNYNERYNS